MKVKLKQLLAAVLVGALVLACGACAPADEPHTLTQLLDHVFEVSTYTTLDQKFVQEYFAAHNDNWGGGCTAVATTLDDGTAIVGRNMDLTISDKCAYVFRTKVKGCYETFGLAYTFREMSPTYAEVMQNGMGETYEKLLPFMSDDVMNTEGLYIEVNMRNGEIDVNGRSKFSCSGTNPNAKERVYVFTLPQYVGLHCANIDEALEYVKTLDIYSQDGYWNYCFMMADATGRYGLLEIAQNKIIWHEGQHAQANFYIDENLAAIENMKCGVGRYEKVMSGIGAVKSEADMFALMDSVTYFQVYSPKTCQFDFRSENVGTFPWWTYDYVMAEENREHLTWALSEMSIEINALSRQELIAMGDLWESVFTEVANCKNKTIFVRFFEDDTRTLTLSFDGFVKG